MTRVSVGYVIQLCDKHLIRERIEVLRIPNKLKQGKYKSAPIDKFTLNTGHELSLMNKIKFLHRRYDELTAECKRRGFQTTDYSDAFVGIPEKYYNDYTPTEEDVAIVRERITERLGTMSNLRYYGVPVTISECVAKLQIVDLSLRL